MKIANFCFLGRGVAPSNDLISCCEGREHADGAQAVIVNRMEVLEQNTQRNINGMQIVPSGPVTCQHKRHDKDVVAQWMESSHATKPHLDSSRMTEIPYGGVAEQDREACVVQGYKSGEANTCSRAPILSAGGAISGCTESLLSSATNHTGPVDQKHLENLRHRYQQVQQRLRSRFSSPTRLALETPGVG